MSTFGTLLKVGVGVGAVAGARQALGTRQEESLAGEVIVVTGASSGLGLEMARELASEGARLVICARTEDELMRARDDLRSRGAEVLAIPCDVAVEDEASRLISETVDHYGRIDGLICNAGVIQVGQIHSLASDDFRRSMDIMYYGTLHPILAAIPHMRRQKSGRITLITSIGGKIAVPYLLPYDAAKFAAVGLGEGLRAELARDGIRVTTVVPGLMRTGSYMNAEFAGSEKGRRAMYRIFSTMSSLPGLTVDGADAARNFVAAMRRGDAYIVYPPQYALLAKVHDLAPATTSAIMSLVARIFPPTGDEKEVVKGSNIDRELEKGGPWRMLTGLGREAAGRMQLRPGTDGPRPTTREQPPA